jgi:tyrosinase
MRIEISIANADAAGRNYVTWAPVRTTLRLFDVPPNGGEPVAVTIQNQNPQAGGQLEFALSRGDSRTTTLDLKVPTDGTVVELFVAGVVGRPSSEDGDAVVQVSRAGMAQPLATKPVMVRIRKNANVLSPAEQTRFTTALAQLNDQGAGLFRNFREMHQEQSALLQAHGAPGFLSWHRAYLLDLERELQKIDPSVSLPYWRFDEPAPAVFTRDFLGESGALGNLVFSPTNLLRLWRTDAGPGITRTPRFNPLTQQAINQFGPVLSQAGTLALGGQNAVFDTGPDFAGDPFAGGFDEMEGDPHGGAHISFLGWIRSASTAPRDPLFFLLHCNVDRLWALWQWLNDRFDGTQPSTYFHRGDVTSADATLIGHNLLDTMWPWNDERGGERPLNAPRTPFPAVPTATWPGPAPTVGDMIDYHGFLSAGSYMNFAYDDVPYGIAP